MRLEDLPALSIVQLHPVILAILDFASALKSLCEKFAQVVVVRGVLEAEVADVAKVFVELLCALLAYGKICERGGLTWEAIAQILDWRSLLLLSDLLVFLLVCSSLEALPWQPSTQEVHENVTESFKVVPTGLLASKMSIDTHVTSCTRQGLALPVGNVLLGLGIAILLCHTEIDDVDHIGTLGARSTDEEVVGLDIAVDQVLLVDGLHPRQLVLDKHETHVWL